MESNPLLLTVVHKCVSFPHQVVCSLEYSDEVSSVLLTWEYHSRQPWQHRNSTRRSFGIPPTPTPSVPSPSLLTLPQPIPSLALPPSPHPSSSLPTPSLSMSPHPSSSLPSPPHPTLTHSSPPHPTSLLSSPPHSSSIHCSPSLSSPSLPISTPNHSDSVVQCKSI